MNPYIELSRPFTLFPPFLVALCGGIIGAIYSNNIIDIYTLFFASISLSLCQAVGQIDNQITDPEDLDKMNNKHRPIVKGIVSKTKAIILLMVLSLLVFLCGLLTKNIVFIISIISLLIGIWLYDHEPIRLKKRFLLNNLILAITRGFIPFIATTALFSKIDITLFLLSIGISLWVFFWQTTKDIPDIKGDKEYNIKTIPVMLGIYPTKLFIIFGSIIFLLYNFIIKEYLLLMLFIPLIIYGIKNLTKKYNGENIIGWKIFYIGIALYYILILMKMLF